MSRKKAEEYVKRGRARWSGDWLEFILDDHRHESAKRSAQSFRDDGLATLAGVKGLPVAGDPVKIFMGKRSLAPVRENRRVVLQIRELPMEAW